MLFSDALSLIALIALFETSALATKRPSSTIVKSIPTIVEVNQRLAEWQFSTSELGMKHGHTRKANIADVISENASV